MADNVVCTVCGGKDFYNDAGFYYCNECSTQTQELREQVYDLNTTAANLHFKTTKLKTNQSQSGTANTTRLTSWEVYNYILAGLVQEMQYIGANSNFKDLTYHFWITYLTELEVLNKTTEFAPKLGAKFKKKDAEILFQRSFSKKKRKAGSVSGISSSSMDSKALSRERAKQKRALFKAEYDHISSTQQSSEPSVHNQTLSSLSADDDSASVTGNISFSKTAKKELLKHMSTAHLNKHINDVENTMTCHKKKLVLSNSYARGPLVLTRNKLYSILYLGLIFSQEKYQISDLVRFCREGHLSYLEYKHLFPEHIPDKCIDEKFYSGGSQKLFTHEFIRRTAFDIYKLLNLKCSNLSPDIVGLCRRYCTELNLPTQIFNLAGDLINQTNPKFPINKKTTMIPNFEGRAMAFIMYILKVLFSIDGVTEDKFTTFARLINEYKHKSAENSKLEHQDSFVWNDWYKYIEYRKFVLRSVHFPTQFLLEPDTISDSDLFVKFVYQRKTLHESNKEQSLSMNVVKKLLGDLEILQEEFKEPQIEFKHSLTPFKSYVETLLKSENVKIKNHKLNHEILQDFSTYTIDFLINAKPYLKAIKSKHCEIKHSNANTNYKFEKMKKTLRYKDSNTKIGELIWHRVFENNKNEKLCFNLIVNKMLEKHLENVNKQKTDKVVSVPEVRPTLCKVVTKTVTNLNACRDNKGRFCAANSPNIKKSSEFKSKKHRGKWFVSSTTRNPILEDLKYNPSLIYQVTKDEQHAAERKRKYSDNANGSNVAKKPRINEEYKVHYIPRHEYCVNVRDVSRMTNGQWQEYESSFPKNFRWLLAECARTIEQSTKSLFMEFVNVELYVNYVHLNNVPVSNKGCDNFKDISRLIHAVKEIW